MASAPGTIPTGPKSKAPASIPPSQTLYLTNLNDRIRKPDLRLSLYILFSTYGVVLDVNALKTMKCRGQAHIAFRDIASATQAMRALQGFNFFGREMKISYAKAKSHAISKLDGTFKIPQPEQGASGVAAGTPFAALPTAPSAASTTNSVVVAEAEAGAEAGAVAVDGAAAAGVKRQREEESDDSDAAMEVEDD